MLFFAWLAVAIVGVVLFWHSGSLAERGIGGDAVPAIDSDQNDMAFYRQIVAGVRDGRNYYDIAREIMPSYYRYGSVFNWRLPTYAYVLAWLGGDVAIRGVLLTLIVVGLWLNFRAELREINLWAAVATVALLFIVLSWVFQDAIYTQELWVATLLTLSLGAWGMQYRWLAVLAGVSALAFRELMLPYPVVAAAVTWRAGRRRESMAWLCGMASFFIFLWWHRGQVQLQLAQMPPVTNGAGIGQWLQWGGFDFLLMTGRLTNVFLYPVPGGIVFVCLWLALLGFVAMPGDRGRVMLFTTLLFWAAFLVIGQPLNFYWGLLYAPMIPFGWIRGLLALKVLSVHPRM
jgi:hypothetical protein